MDLAAIIAEKKKKAGFGKKRWQKRGELEEEPAQPSPTKRNKLKRKREEERTFSFRKKKKAAKSDAEGDGKDDHKALDAALAKLTELQVLRRLRELRQPIILYAESSEERRTRLRNATILHQDRSGRGTGSEFQDIISDQVEKELEAAMAAGGNDDEYSKHLLKQKIKKRKYDVARPRSEFEKPHDYIVFFLKRLLYEWERELLDRSEAVRRSPEGRKENAIQKQCRKDIRPLFKTLKNRDVATEVLKGFERICVAMEKRDYVTANNEYVTFSIGNAPWPVGTTSCAIHQRTGHDKIRMHVIAHVMNNEKQRKYIHAFKRLLAYSQKKYPNNKELSQNFYTHGASDGQHKTYHEAVEAQLK